MRNFVVKPWTELKFEHVDLQNDDTSWNYGRGGEPLKPDDWYISFQPRDQSKSEIRYVMPPCIMQIIDARYNRGLEDGERILKGKIQELLGI